jgi:hypothetical protein
MRLRRTAAGALGYQTNLSQPLGIHSEEWIMPYRPELLRHSEGSLETSLRVGL